MAQKRRRKSKKWRQPDRKRRRAEFSKKTSEDALVNSRRCCCLCHRFAGIRVNVHHIIPSADSGASTLDNAIVLCFDCHADAGHYNAAHPLGKKFSPDELRRHRDESWKWCTEHPEAPLPDDPISISPNSIHVAATDWQPHVVLTIHNKTHAVLYSVWIKLNLFKFGVKAEAFAFGGPGSSLLQIPVGPTLLSADTIAIGGTDESGNEAVYLQLYRLGPESSLVLPFTVKSGGRDGQITATLLSFRQTADVHPVSRPNEMGVPFTCPENVSMRVFSIYRIK